MASIAWNVPLSVEGALKTFRKLPDIPRDELFVGKQVFSTYSKQLGEITEIHDNLRQDFDGNIGVVVPISGKLRCMKHDDDHSFAIFVTWENGHESIQAHCDYGVVEEI